MRFASLRIPAYGPFTNFALDLPRSATGDLHILHGPNEAGKSSLLRAIRALLFGIPAQTPDNFRHDYTRMLIVADLEMPDGGIRTFQRRKGNKNTLLNAAGQSVPEQELTACLGEVDAAYFDSMFGLDSTRLREGANALLRGEGRLGEALFSASMGSTPVDLVIRDLEQEAQEIFSGRAQKRLRQSARTRSEHLQKMKEAMVSPATWEHIELQLREAEKHLHTLQTRRESLVNRKAWLERCRDAMAMVGTLRSHQAALANLPTTNHLPETFASELIATRNAKLEKEKEVRLLEAELAALRKQSTQSRPGGPILSLASLIEDIHAHHVAYENDISSLSNKQAEVAAARQLIHTLCKDLGITHTLEDIEALRMSQIEFAHAEELAAHVEKCTRTHDDAIKRIAELTNSIEKLKSSAPPSNQELLATLRSLRNQAAQVLDKATTLDERQNALKILSDNLAQLHKELTGAPKDYQTTCDLPIPAMASLEKFRKQWEDLHAESRETQKTCDQLRSQAANIQSEIKLLTRLRDIPTLDQLIEARTHRDRCWALVLEDWKGPGTNEKFVAGKPLEEAYPEAVRAADHVADRLRAEADAVAQMEEKLTRLKQIEDSLSAQQQHLKTLEASQAALDRDWKQAWQGTSITPTTPAEMLAWRQNWQEFRKAWKDFESHRATLEADTQSVRRIMEAMSATLHNETGSFASLLQLLERKLNTIESSHIQALATQQRIEHDSNELASLQQTLEQLELEKKTAIGNWQHLASKLSLPTDLSPAWCIKLLEARREVFHHKDRLASLLADCSHLQSSLAAFEEKVKKTASRAGLPNAPIKSLAENLWTELQHARERQKNHELLQNQLDSKSQLLAARQAELKALDDNLNQLLSKAALDHSDQVDAFAANFQKALKLRHAMEDLHASLAGLARGENTNTFIHQVTQEDAAGIDGQIAGLTQHLADLDQQLEAAHRTRHEIAFRKAELEKADDQAARHAQLAQFEESQMLADAQRYIELQMALALLKSQINQFREKNQGPFLSRASHWFSKLTAGGFEAIVPSFTHGDEPTITGRRKGDHIGQEVTVDGLSEGTRDQLFLALRLAGLELHLTEHPPMPFILDDLLAHFDDHRATHALHALAELSQKCQILLFTHHQHLVTLATENLDRSSFTCHPLPPPH